jgi:hypothetical protein
MPDPSFNNLSLFTQFMQMELPGTDCLIFSLLCSEKSSKGNRPTEQKSRTGGPKGLQLKMVYKVFGYLQVSVLPLTTFQGKLLVG